MNERGCLGKVLQIENRIVRNIRKLRIMGEVGNKKWATLSGKQKVKLKEFVVDRICSLNAKIDDDLDAERGVMYNIRSKIRESTRPDSQEHFNLCYLLLYLAGAEVSRRAALKQAIKVSERFVKNWVNEKSD